MGAWMGSPREKYTTQEETFVSEQEEEPELQAPPVPYDEKILNMGYILNFYDFSSTVFYRDVATSLRRITHRASQRPRALKQFSKKNFQKYGGLTVRDQIGMLQMLRKHPNVIRLYETFEDRQCYYLVLELCQGGRLFEHIKEAGRHSERETASAVHQVLKAVEFMHEHLVCHRDLKPEHIMLKNKGSLIGGTLKVIDFGQARMLNKRGEVLRDQVGTPYYSAPQVHQGKGYTELSDCWSVGVIMYLLLFNFPHVVKADPHMRRAYSMRTINPLQYDIMAAGQREIFKPEENVMAECSEGASDLVKRLLEPDEERRCEAERALKHAWVVRHTVQPEDLRVQLSGTNLSTPDVPGASRVRPVGVPLPFGDPPVTAMMPT
jgi:serine/threonine protein kinase